MHRGRFPHAAKVELLAIGIAAVIAGAVAFDGRQSSSAPRPAALAALAADAGTPAATSAVPTAVTTLLPTKVATPVPGEVIILPASGPGDLTLIATDILPSITQQQAMQAVYDMGVPWGLGDSYEGKTPVISATFGLATFGSQAPDGQWVGLRNIPLPSGEMLDHIESRPVWIVDYGNTVAYGSQAVFSNTVYAVDTATGVVVKTWFYNPNPAP